MFYCSCGNGLTPDLVNTGQTTSAVGLAAAFDCICQWRALNVLKIHSSDWPPTVQQSMTPDSTQSMYTPEVLCPKAQYTPTMTTRLRCRVELRRRFVLNSQLVGDGSGRRIESGTC